LQGRGQSAEVDAMHSVAIHCLKLTAHSAQRVVLAGNNNTRANNNANHWRARA
jgi:hypothetical protein